MGELARERFADGKLIREDHLAHSQAVKSTETLLASGTASALFEPAFTFEKIRTRVDILNQTGGELHDLIEVKSSTSSKAEHIPDIAIQLHVLEGSGVRVGSPGASYVSLEHLGKERLGALRNPEIGPYSQKPLDRQYFVMPKSVADSYGSAFIDDLKAEMNTLYVQEVPYDPILIEYDDLVEKSLAAQGSAVLAAVESVASEPGYGIVMIHEADRGRGEHDQLAAMLMAKLREQELYVSIIHTKVARESYRFKQNASNGSGYTAVPEKKTRLVGYLRKS